MVSIPVTTVTAPTPVTMLVTLVLAVIELVVVSIIVAAPVSALAIVSTVVVLSVPVSVVLIEAGSYSTPRFRGSTPRLSIYLQTPRPSALSTRTP